jgi:eukaryotic-like serine/threonine-protein kinase
MGKDDPIAQGEIVGDRYRIERIVAEGGMGVIVAAKHLELEETVAIKFLRPEYATKPEIVGRFAREAKATARIKSLHTATILDVGISRERGPYIVMEYLEGEDLESVIQADGRMPYARAAELVMQAGEAIGTAHAAGIIHRDIKPANLFLVKSDQSVPIIKVLDFGVSKTALTGNMFGGAISLVTTQSLLGSPIYMAPEQVRGNFSGDYRTDVWSLGAVLYELITGETAFTGETVTDICLAVVEETPVPITRRAPDAPAELDAVVMRCLEKDPARRFPNIAELVIALAPFAPKRARMSVDRVIAVSKAAGILPSDYVTPPSILPPPPSSNSSMAIDSTIPPPKQKSPPQEMLETMFSADDDSSRITGPTLSTQNLGVHYQPRPKWPIFAALALIMSATAVSVIWLAPPPPAGTSTTPPVRQAAAELPEPPPPAPTPEPPAVAVTNAAAASLPAPVRKASKPRPKAAVAAPGAAVPSASADPVRSAIDDRK